MKRFTIILASLIAALSLYTWERRFELVQSQHKEINSVSLDLLLSLDGGREFATKRKAKPKVSGEQAIIAAVNHVVETSPGVIELTHPLHRSKLTAESGLTFTPNRSPSPWRWQLRHFGGERQSWVKSEHRKIPAQRFEDHSFGFDYGLFVERYVPREKTLEQQFVIREKPFLVRDEDLVIRGEIDAGEAVFEEHEAGWVWRDPKTRRVTSLGDVYVYDAEGEEIAAEMLVISSETTIRVDGGALLAATFPVTVDPEIGTDDFGISFQAFTDWSRRNPSAPKMAYNPDHDVAMVVWSGTMADGQREVFARVCNSDGEPLSDPVQVSASAPNGPRVRFHSDVAYDRGTQRFVIVWSGRPEGFAEGHTEIFARSYPPSGIPDDPFQVTIVENITTPDVGAVRPLVTAGPNGQVLVTWAVNGDLARNVPFSLKAQMVDVANRTVIGGPLTIQDDMAPVKIAAAFNSNGGEFLVAWGRRNAVGAPNDVLTRRMGLRSGGLVLLESDAEIVGQFPPATSLNDLGLALDPRQTEYLLTWSLTDDEPGSGNLGVFGQRLDERGREIGADDFRIDNESSRGRGSAVCYDLESQSYIIAHLNPSMNWLCVRQLSASGPPSLVNCQTVQTNYDGRSEVATITGTSGGRFLVVYPDAEPRRLHDGDEELFIRAWKTLPAGGIDAIGEHYHLSETPAPQHQGSFNAFDPEVVFIPDTQIYPPGTYLVIWRGDGGNINDRPAAREEFEIFARSITHDGQPLRPTAKGFAQARRITHMGEDGDSGIQVGPPIIALRQRSDRLSSGVLIVFSCNGEDGTARDKSEVYGIFVNSDGIPRANPFRITFTGNDDEPAIDASEPDVAWDSLRDRFMVVWKRDGNSILDDDKFVIRGAMILGGDTSGVIEDRFLVSPHPSQIPSANEDGAPAVVFDGQHFLVVFRGVYNVGGGMEHAIWSQRFTSFGKVFGHAPIQRVSSPNVSFHADHPDVAFNPVRNEHCVVWQGSFFEGGPSNIYGQRLSKFNVHQDEPFKINHLASSFAFDTESRNPRINYVPAEESYLVAWQGHDRRSGRGIPKRRVFAQWVGDEGEIDSSNVWLSGPTVEPETIGMAVRPDGEAMVVWQSLDNSDSFHLNHQDIYGQRYHKPGHLEMDVSIENDRNVAIALLNAEAGAKYVFQASSDLKNWTFLTFSEVAFRSGTLRFLDENAFNEFDQRFYRIFRAPN